MGFPSPADDYTQRRLDLVERLTIHEHATFFMRAGSNAMARAGIAEGDVLVVDRALKASYGHIVVAVVDGEFLIRRLESSGEKHMLISADSRMREIPLDNVDCQIWGVVVFSIRQHAQ